MTHEVTFLDASGGAQDAFDEETTEQVIFVMSLSGTGLPPLGRPGKRFRGERPEIEPLEASVERKRGLTASGLVGENETVVWNGTGESSSVHSFQIDGTVWTRSVITSSTVTDVVMPYPRTEDSWPLSGSITQHVTHTGAGAYGDRVLEVDAVVIFNGTRCATVTLNGETLEIDLGERRHRGFGGHARKP